ncbi:MAG: hypothetical protein JW860_01300 [Sedimentisphaerales bacterium]|nr:hypothetical protein [Sedimentisphaerales bacterium]
MSPQWRNPANILKFVLMVFCVYVQPAPADTLIDVLNVPTNSHVSAAIYNSNGERIKELLAYEPTGSNTQIELRWDGKDEYGRSLPADAIYQWRALATDAVFHIESCVGNTGNPWADGLFHNGNVDGIVFDSSGNCYTASVWEEYLGNTLRKLDSNWNVIWSVFRQGAQRITTDDTYLYVAAEVGSQDCIYKYYAANGGFVSSFVVNFSTQGSYTSPGLRGIDVDSTRIWVADYYNDRIKIYTKTGSLLGQFTVNEPEGLAVQSEPGVGPGVLWVAHENKVSKYTFTLAYNDFTEVTSITGLNNPAALDIGGPSGHLFIVERGNERILEYDISSTPTPAGNFHQFGPGFTRGQLGDDEFWQVNGVAVAPDGRVAVSDAGNFRVQLFDADTNLLHSDHLAWQPAPFVDKITSSTHRMMTMGYEYEVDLSGTHHPEWMAGGGDGTWRLVANWWDPPFATMFYFRRLTLDVPGLGPRDYIFCMNKDDLGGFSIYQVSPDGTTSRRSAIVGRRWMGENGEIIPGDLARWAWKDSNGDDQIQTAEVTFKDALGTGYPFTYSGPGMCVDASGNLYYAPSEPGTINGEAIKIPLLGFDAIGNPIYSWDQSVHLVAEDTSGDNFQAKEIRIDTNGDILLYGTSLYAPLLDTVLNTGGTIIRRYDSSGNFLFEYQASAEENTTFSGFEVDPIMDSEVGLWAAPKTGTRVHALTHDGLMLVETKPTQWPFSLDWFDIGSPFYVFALPSADSGQRYIYAESVVSGSALRMRVENLDDFIRHDGYFNWIPTGEQIVTVHRTADASESGLVNGAFEVRRIGGTQNSLTVYYTVSGTAESGSDFDPLSGSMVIPVNAGSAQIPLVPVDDFQAEDNEWVTLTLSTDPAYTIGLDSFAHVSIIDDESASLPEINVTMVQGDANENGSAQGAIQISRNDPNGAIIVNYDISGSASRADFVKLDGSVTLNHGVSTTTVAITPIDDSDIEIDETVILSLAPGADYQIGSSDSGSVVIVDDDYPLQTVIGFDFSNMDLTPSTISSGMSVGGMYLPGTGALYSNGNNLVFNGIYTGTDIRFDVTVPADHQLTITEWGIGHIQISESADSTVEVYVTGDATASLGSGVLASYSGGIINTEPDLVLNAGNYTFHLRILGHPPVSHNGEGGSLDDLIFSGFLIDYSAGPLVSVYAPDAIANEGWNNNGTFKIARSITIGNMTVNYSVSGSAVSGSDYTALSGSVTISEGRSSATVILSPLDDTDPEDFDTVILMLLPGTGYTVGMPSSATVTIDDNENVMLPIVNVVQTDTLAAEEGSNPGMLTIQRDDATGPLTVLYTITGSASDTDYTESLSGTASMADGMASMPISVTPIDDNIIEIDETVTVTLVPHAAYIVGSSSSGTISIEDNDPTGPLGDFDSNGILEANDIDLLYAEINAETHIPGYDLTDDGLITQADADMWVQGLVGTRYGDVNLDARVDLLDFAELSMNWQNPGFGWASGDFNGDQAVDILDLSYQSYDWLFEAIIVSITASDPCASEAGPDPGTCMVQRSNSSGDLMVYYTLSGTASPVSPGLIPIAVTGVTTSSANGSETGQNTIDGVLTLGNWWRNNWMNTSDPWIYWVFGTDYALETMEVANYQENNYQNNRGIRLVDIYIRQNGGWILWQNDYQIPIQAESAAVTFNHTINFGGLVVSGVLFDPEDNYFATWAGPVWNNDPGNDLRYPGPVGDAEAMTGLMEVAFYQNAMSDYQPLSGNILIPDGQNAVPIIITPNDDSEVEGPETVIISLFADYSYSVGSPSSAIVTINDDD